MRIVFIIQSPNICHTHNDLTTWFKNINNTELISQRNHRDATNLLYSNSLSGIVVSIIAASVLVFGFPNDGFGTLKLNWWIGMVSIMLLRLTDLFFWKFSLEKSEYDSKTPMMRFITGCIVSAFSWAIYSVLVFEQLEIIELAVLVTIYSSLAGGASTVLAANRYVSLFYSVIIILPISVCGLLADLNYQNLLGLLGIVFCGIMVLSGLKSAEFTRYSIRLKNENQNFLEQLEAEKAETSRIHTELNLANAELNNIKCNLESEVQKRSKKIGELSNLDPLTGLVNRSSFINQLAELLETNKSRNYSLAVLFIDLDGFKEINDNFGHKAGDIVLSKIALRLKAFSDKQYVARWGGDEFVIVLPYANAETAMSIADAIKISIAQPIELDAHEFNLNASVGISLAPLHTSNELELIQFADFAMSEKKRCSTSAAGLFTHELYADLKAAQTMRDGLQQAISNKELYLCYQPIISAIDGKTWSYETLLRWNFNGTPVRPDVFIPLAEQTGLIKDIGAWVLNRACIDASQWQFDQRSSVSVNVSVIQLMDESFVQILDSALRSSGLKPERLTVEITESVFADNKGKVQEQLRALKERRVKVSIDDFGTGYSSLSQLQSLEFDHVKIDKSFVHSLAQGSGAIIRATLVIAREFNCRTVAEGIETQAQAEVLTQLGVDFLQGYMYAKPMLNDELGSWNRARELDRMKQA